MSEEMVELISKAKAQAKHEAVLSFLGKNSKIVIRLILTSAILGIFVVGFLVYKNANQKKFSEILHRSLINQQLGEIDEAKKELKKIVESSSAPSGVKSLASLRYSAFLLKDGKKSEAVKIYLDLSNCYSCDEYVRDLARLLAVKVWMTDEAELQKSDLSNRIKKLEDSASILRGHIAEQRAFLALQENKKEEARKIFEEIVSYSEKNENLKMRAGEGIKMSK